MFLFNIYISFRIIFFKFQVSIIVNSESNPVMQKTCFLHNVPWTYLGRTLDVPWTYLGRTLSTFGRTLDVPWTYLDVPWTYLGRTLDVPWTYLGRTDVPLDVPWTYLDAILYLPKGKKVYFFCNFELSIINCPLSILNSELSSFNLI